MKKMPIRLRITIWYTIFLTLLVLLVLWLLFTVSESRVESDAQLQLQDAVLSSYQNIEYQDGELDFDDDLNDALDSGIYLLAYDSQGHLLYGRTPSRFSGASSLIMDELQEVSSDGAVWYVYDYCQYVEGYGNIWVRGITSHSQVDSILHTLLGIALLSLPFLVLCIALGGYSITRKALAPLSDMTEAARQISEGKDLSRRIRLESGDDEVHRLAHTFDRMMDRLQTSFENERQFTSDVSHELRTPVSVILSQCEYASRPDSSPEEAQECIASIAGQAKKMSNLISQLLILSRADSGRQELHYEPMNISELAEIVADEQREFAAVKNISIETDIQPDLLIRADETMILRLLINLLSNSITYGKENGRTLLSLKAQEAEILGVVSDNGIGIPEEHLDKIWNRFYQVDPSRSRNQNGSSGLGLSMVRWIVEAHGGTIQVESVLGEGTSFTFRLPQRKEP